MIITMQSFQRRLILQSQNPQRFIYLVIIYLFIMCAHVESLDRLEYPVLYGTRNNVKDFFFLKGSLNHSMWKAESRGNR